MMPEVTVVVPVFNVEKYLHQCIESLLNQTYRNLEIILVDDGSTDNSGAICDKYRQKDQRIKVIHKCNQGLGFARNSGMKETTSDYITFMDSDDYADEDMIEELMRPIIDENADTVIGGFKKVNDEKKILFIDSYNKKTYINDAVYNDFFIRILGSSPGNHDFVRMSVWNSIYSMKIIKEHDIVFPSERIMISEDLIFGAVYYKYARVVSVISSSKYNYRYNTTSLSEKYRANKFQLVNDLYLEMKKRITNTFERQEEADNRLKTMYLIQLRNCIGQENISGKNISEKINSVKKMCENDLVRHIIETYPYDELSYKQKIFIDLIRHKNCRLLLLLLKVMY